MANEKEREKDVGLLDSAAAGMSELANMELDANAISGEDFRAYSRIKIEAAKALVPLLERRSKLLGLDAPERKAGSGDGKPDAFDELERKLALVAPTGQGKAS